MAEDDTSSLTALFDQVRFLLRELVDFTRTDTEATIAKVRLLTAASAYFNGE